MLEINDETWKRSKSNKNRIYFASPYLKSTLNVTKSRKRPEKHGEAPFVSVFFLVVISDQVLCIAQITEHVIRAKELVLHKNNLHNFHGNKNKVHINAAVSRFT